MLIGYVRVLFTDQNVIDQQHQLLQQAGCQKIYTDIKAEVRQRSNLSKALSLLQPGDTLFVTQLDRLGYRMKDLVLFVKDLTTRGIFFCSLQEDINTAEDNGIFAKTLVALMAMEEELLKEKTRYSLAIARNQGGKGGRKRKMTKAKVEAAKALFSRGMPPAEISEYLGVSIPTLYRWCPARERM